MQFGSLYAFSKISTETVVTKTPEIGTPFMSDSFSSTAATKQQTTLGAACLGAILVTAFATPSHAAVNIAPTFQTSDGTQIQDGYYLSTSNIFDNTTPVGSVDMTFPDLVSPLPVIGSQPAASAEGDSVVVFTQSPNNFIGEDFTDAFLSGTNYTEAEVATYIGSDFTDTDANDTAAYNTFVTSLVNNYETANNASDPIDAYMFTGGQSIGTISAAQLASSGASSPYTGFGLTAHTAVPEAGTLPLLLLGGAGLLGITAVRRRRQMT
jgi:hypothetical protein